MANGEEYEEVSMAEEALESALSGEKFQDVGFFKRLGKMFSGLSKPHDSREYKEARIEVQRLSAPLLAFLLPTAFFVILIVVTATGGGKKEAIIADIQKAEVEEEKLEEPEPPPDVEPPPETDDVQVEVDIPAVGTPTEVAASVPVMSNEPQSPKPAEQDAMAAIPSPVTMKSVMASSRATGVRGKYTSGGANYGDQKTEAAVMKALRWLKFTQKSDGSWGGVHSAAFAILTYLAHGETPASKEFGETVMAAIDYLLGALQEDSNGKPSFKGSDGNEYSFLIATYALCEAYGMTKNPNCKEAAEICLKRIVDNQSPTGGWDYRLNKASTRDDLSFGGWALQAVKAGKMAGIHVSGMEPCIKRAITYLKTRAFVNGGFGYCAGGAPTGLTATGCLCMQLLGYTKDKEVAAACDFMRTWEPAWKGGNMPGGGTQYYCYYAAQCKYQAGMREGANAVDQKSWKEWNAAMKALYPNEIVTLEKKIEGPDGKEKEMGYWKDGYHDQVMGTCLVALQLMVYYRYLPTTSLKATSVADDVKAATATADKSGDVGVTIDL
ncbi:MAG: terpene cyclase/mutase family protein [Kiritimatiellae bacterium]|nr:terpene cyclase/mutase family protein [Kiritimatiellia bacterium]